MGSIPNSITKHNSMATSRDEPFRIPVLITNILPCEPAPSADNRSHGEEMPERGAERPWRGETSVNNRKVSTKPLCASIARGEDKFKDSQR